MASSYPGGLDDFTAIGAADEMDDSVGGRTHRAMHNDANDAVEAIEAELGLDPAGASATVVARLDALDTTAAGAALKAANLSDLASAATSRTNLGLAGAALLAVGTTTGTVAAGDDSRITGAAQKASNLSDLADASAARTALGLGTMATAAAADYALLAGATFTGAVRIDGSANTYQLRVQGHSTQTVQLQTWENSGGSLQAAALVDGSLLANYFGYKSNTGPRFQMSATGVNLANRDTVSNVVLAVSGMASQSGNLTEWRNSAATVLASISAAGALTANGVTVAAGYSLAVGGAGDFGGGVGVVSIAQAGTEPTTDPTGGGVLYVDSAGDLVFRGASGTITTIASA
jgi:hypothetical protein